MKKINLIFGLVFIFMISSVSAITLEYDKEFLFSEALEGYFNDIDNFTYNLQNDKFCVYNLALDKIVCNATSSGVSGDTFENLTVTNNLSISDGFIDFGESKISQNGYLTFYGQTLFNDPLTLTEDFTYTEDDNHDFNLLWNSGSVFDSLGGKLQIQDTRKILTNLTEVNQSINNFEVELLPLISYSVSPETGRDYSLNFDPECFNNRCVRARGGNLKSLGYSRNTGVIDGVGINNITYEFYLTTEELGGGETFEVIINDNEGNTSTLYTINSETTNTHIHIDVPALYLNKDNVTVYFELDAGYSVASESTIWIDDLSEYILFNDTIALNYSYFGGHIGFGSDEGSYAYIDKSEYFEIGEGFKTKLTLNADVVEFVGDVVSTSVTFEEQLITGDFNVSGNIYVGGGFDSGGVSILNTGTLSVSDDILIGGDVLVVQDVQTNGSLLPTQTNTFNVGSSAIKWQEGYFNNFVRVNNLYLDENSGGGSSITNFVDMDDGYIGGNSSHVCFGTNSTKLCLEK